MTAPPTARAHLRLGDSARIRPELQAELSDEDGAAVRVTWCDGHNPSSAGDEVAEVAELPENRVLDEEALGVVRVT